MQHEASSWEDLIWVFGWPIAFVVILWLSSGCGGGLAGSYLMTTRQGVTVSTIGSPNLEQLAELDDIIDLVIQRWRERFGTTEMLTGRFYDHLAQLELVIRDSQIRIDRTEDISEGKLSWGFYDGMQKGREIHVMKRSDCWGWTPLVHELTHWILWVMTGDPQPAHPAGPVWGVGETFVWQTTGELVKGGCHE